MCASLKPVVAMTVGVFALTAYSSRPGRAAGDEKSIITSTFPLKLKGETNVGNLHSRPSRSIPAVILISSRLPAKAVTALPMLPQHPLSIIFSIISPYGTHVPFLSSLYHSESGEASPELLLRLRLYLRQRQPA